MSQQTCEIQWKVVHKMLITVKKGHLLPGGVRQTSSSWFASKAALYDWCRTCMEGVPADAAKAVVESRVCRYPDFMPVCADEPNLTEESIQLIRQACLRAVGGPGKFEGNPIYVPYYWGKLLDGSAGDVDGNVLSFNVSTEDKVIFPELRRRKVVRLVEDSQGFMIEA